MDVNLSNFLSNSNILVTGGTGFLGKVLIEKLLRSQTNIKKLYILIRPKNGKSVDERLQQDILEKQLFDKLKQEKTNYASKIIVIEGDICQKELGLSENDKIILLNEINIIYNCAGSTNLSSPLKDSINSNCISVAELLKLCRQMKKLKSVVLLSTIHANYLNRKIIEEKIYCSSITSSLIFKMCEEMDDELVRKITEPILGGYPNSYTFSKSIMEKLLLENFSDLPIILFRSAIVINSYQDPLPGWIEDNHLHVNTAYNINLGVLRVVNIDPETKLHLVPVDFCVNALICSSWHGIKRRTTQNYNEISVYNYAFEKRKRSWRFCFNSIMETDIKLGRSIWKPVYISSQNILFYYILRFFLHFLPGALMDAGLLVLGYEARFLKMYDKIYANFQKLAYLTNNEWRCRENNVLEMLNEMSLEEQKYYAFDGNKIVCNTYARNICTGIKLYLANESMEDNEKHLRRHKRLVLLHSGLRHIFWSFLVLTMLVLLYRIHAALWRFFISFFL